LYVFLFGNGRGHFFSSFVGWTLSTSSTWAIMALSPRRCPKRTSRVGRRSDLDRLTLEIYTDGTLKPSRALALAAKILISHFNQIINPVIEPEAPASAVLPAGEDEVLRLSVEELDLPTRIANALKKGGYATVKDLASASREEIAKVKNLGEKSLEVVIKKLKAKGVEVK